MKPLEEVRNRAKSLVLEELNRRMVETQSKLPCNCIYNHQQPIDLRKKVRNEPNPNYNTISATGPKIGLCMYGASDIQSWPGNICDEPSDAKGCPLYTSKHSKESVLRAFHEDLENRTWVESNMPILGALLWVLDEGYELPWWKRFFLRFGWFRTHRTSKVRALLSAPEKAP